MNKYLIKKSKIKEGYYYVECDGAHDLDDVSEKTGISVEKLDEIYKKNDGVFCHAKEVYYFYGYSKCVNVIDVLNKHTKTKTPLRQISLTDEEIEYIRRALINEDSNIIFTESKVRDEIFKKLNF